MGDSYTFTLDVLRAVCDRFLAKAADLRLMVGTKSSFEEWLNWEANLACKGLQGVTRSVRSRPGPPTPVKGVAEVGDDPGRNFGNLRVGGSYEEEGHRWVFAEFALLHDGNLAGGKWLRKIEADADKLRRRGGSGRRPC